MQTVKPGATVTAEQQEVIQELTDLIGQHPHAYIAVETSYGVTPAKTHAEAVATALKLAGTKPDFEQRFQAELKHIKNFHWGKGMRIFAAILTGGASLIAEGIAKAVKAHQAAKAAQAQQQALAQGATPAQAAAAATSAATTADPVATAAAHPEQKQAAQQQGFWAWVTSLFKGKPAPAGPSSTKHIDGEADHPAMGGKGPVRYGPASFYNATGADGKGPSAGMIGAIVVIVLVVAGTVYYFVWGGGKKAAA